MKKKYSDPILETVVFSDIITTSSGGTIVGEEEEGNS